VRKLVRVRRGSIALIVAAALAGWGLLTMFAVRAWQTAETDRQLCQVIHDQITLADQALDDPGSPGFAYWAAHPDERAAAHERHRMFLAELPCHDLPSNVG
jgi:hypothetical protein